VPQVLRVRREELQVLDAVVLLVPASVVHHLPGLQVPAQVLLHHEAVLQDVLAPRSSRMWMVRPEQQDVAVLIHDPATAPVRMPRATPRPSSVAADPVLLAQLADGLRCAAELRSDGFVGLPSLNPSTDLGDRPVPSREPPALGPREAVSVGQIPHRRHRAPEPSRHDASRLVFVDQPATKQVRIAIERHASPLHEWWQ
jgi:hypothetical protein